MTLAELNRAVSSWHRVEKRKAQEQAAQNYILANLVGKCVASYFSEEITLPELAEVYPHLFEEQSEKKQEAKRKAKDELSALRFRQFANSHNERFNKGVQGLSE